MHAGILKKYITGLVLLFDTAEVELDLVGVKGTFRSTLYWTEVAEVGNNEVRGEIPKDENKVCAA